MSSLINKDRPKEPKLWLSTIAIILGVMMLLGSCGNLAKSFTERKQRETVGIDIEKPMPVRSDPKTNLVRISFLMVIGTLSYRSAKRRGYGSRETTQFRLVSEGIPIVLTFLLWLTVGKETWVADPFNSFVLPLWVINAYIIMISRIEGRKGRFWKSLLGFCLIFLIAAFGGLSVSKLLSQYGLADLYYTFPMGVIILSLDLGYRLKNSGRDKWYLPAEPTHLFWIPGWVFGLFWAITGLNSSLNSYEPDVIVSDSGVAKLEDQLGWGRANAIDYDDADLVITGPANEAVVLLGYFEKNPNQDLNNFYSERTDHLASTQRFFTKLKVEPTRIGDSRAILTEATFKEESVNYTCLYYCIEGKDYFFIVYGLTSSDHWEYYRPDILIILNSFEEIQND
jgi:hypothetical protein